MNKSAILHIPLSQYAFSSSEQRLTIRIRTAKEDLTCVTLYYGDRACKSSPVQFYPIPMTVVAKDEQFDYYEVTFDSPFTRVCYYFKLEKEEEWTYYYADIFAQKLPDFMLQGKLVEGRSEYYQYPFILRAEILDVPAWFKQAVVYNIFPDSFATSKEYISCQSKEVLLEDEKVCKSKLGGTIRGIHENLDYIQNMGFNCIYLNPIFIAGECHKYDILDYYHIDPCFGTDDDFKELVNEIHHRGMHIIIDGVFNHCSWYFFAFDDVIRNQQESAYMDWFYHLNFPVSRPQTETEIPSYDCFAYERKMPKLNTSNPKVQQYFAKVCRYWLEEFKVDGWRLDVANEIDRNFWRTFRATAKSVNPDAVLIGEVWENSETWLRGDAFDSTMNYDFRKHCREFFGLGEITAKQFIDKITQMELRYPKNITLGQLNLLDSHDVPRFLSICEENLDRYRLALIFLLMSPGVPSIFYGDELAIHGITESEYRSPMDWEHQECPLREFLTKLIQIRLQYTDPDATFLMEVKKDNLELICISRSGKKGKLFICLNVSKKAVKLPCLDGYHDVLSKNVKDGEITEFGYGVYVLE